MPDQPLQPFAPPQGFSQLFPAGIISAGHATEWLLYAVFAFWIIYTIVAVYHWLKYSHDSWIAFPAIIIHVVVSVILVSYALSGSLLIV